MAPPRRSTWKGHLRLSLVSIAVELFPALAPEAKVALNQLHRETGKRIRYEKTVPGIGAVDASDIVKGYEIEDDTYVMIEDDELDAIKLESKHTIDLVQFVDVGDVDTRYIEKPYYLAPQGDVSIEGYIVLRDALRKENKVGLGQVTMRGREYLVAVRACGKGMLLETLRYADEVRAAEEYFDEIDEPKIDKELRDLAGELISRKIAPFKPERFQNHYAAALRDLIEEKRKGHAIIASPEDETRERAQSNVIDLMEALKRSVRGDRKPERAAAKHERSEKPERATKAAAASAPRTKRKTAPARPRKR